MHFAHPYLFLLLLLLIPLWVYYFSYRKKGGFSFSSLALSQIRKQERWKVRSFVSYGDLIFKSLFFLMLVFVMARPQLKRSETKRKSSGLDIVLAVDASESMRQRDYVIDRQYATRMDVVRKVVGEFVKHRPNDRIGLVVFGDFAFTRSPLTLDHDVLHEYIQGVEIGVAGGKTAIGDAIAVAVKRIKDIPSKSKIVILLSDGEDNSSDISPTEAARLAKTLKTKVYTVGMERGSQNMLSRFSGRFRGDHLTALKEIAEITDAKFFRVNTTENLRDVYKEIDRLEKTEIETKEFIEFDEAYFPFAVAGLVFFIFDILFGLSRFRRIP